jgi:peptide/nickel transport system substrate-binding protein
MTLPEQVVGSGPFEYAESIRGSFYRFTRNDDYYEPALPYLAGVTYLVMPSSAVRLAALMAGEVDVLMLITEPEAEALASTSDIRVIRDPSAGGNTVQMNMSVPPFDDPRVRLAINLAFDRDEARVALGGGFDGAVMPAGGPWALDDSAVDGLPGYGDKVAERAEARALLATAGFADGLNVEMHTRSDPFSSSLAEFAAAQLSTIGVDVEIVAMERTAYQDFLLRGEHGLISHSHSFALDDPDAILPAHYSCGGSENFPGLCDDDIDRMISEQSKLLDYDARLALVAEIQSLIWAENSKIWFNWSVRRTPVWRHVNNFDPGGPSLYQGRRLDAVWLTR